MERILTVLENTPLAPGVFRLLLDGAEADDVRAPGQFFNLSVDGFYLRRPISVCDAAGSRVTLIYKVVGAGTRALSDYRPGRTLRVLTALGNGYDLTVTGSPPLLLGGGAGVPPMYLLAKALLARGVRPTVVLGFNTASEVFYKAEFESLGVPTVVATADGSAGVPGFVTDAAREALAGVDTLLLEANHDVETLQYGPYPYFLKRRILGDEGHLSNDAAAEFARLAVQSGTRDILLAHLSKENNTPELAEYAVARALQSAGLSVRLGVAPRDTMSEVHLCRRSPSFASAN